MSQTLEQINVANPNAVLQDTDLLYVSRSPYTPGLDRAITWANLKSQLIAQLQFVGVWINVLTPTQQMAVNTGYIAANAAGVAFTLPTTANIGDSVDVDGNTASGWTIDTNVGQTIHFGVDDAANTIGSTNIHDCVTLRCINANTDWIVESSQGNLSYT
jgi:hypothetical protein